MRLVWTDEAVSDLEKVAERAPRAAAHVYEAVEWMGRQNFPHMFRRVAGSVDQHVLSRPPYVVLYAIKGDALEIQIIEDARQQREPW